MKTNSLGQSSTKELSSWGGYIRGQPRHEATVLKTF